MLSRRDFLLLGGLMPPLALLAPRFVRAAAPAPGGPALGLFFDASDVPVLRERYASPMFEELRAQMAEIDRPALRRFMAEEVRYNDHLYHIQRLARAAERLAFVYAVTGDEEAADLSAESVRTIMKFPKWDYFLEGGDRVFGLQRAPESSVAVVLSADWLGDRIDAAERDAWLRTMGERGLEAAYLALYGMRHPDRVEGWSMDETSTYFEHRPNDRIDLSNWPHILDGTNLKAVPASALAMGTAAYRKHFGADANSDRWLEQALYSLGTLRHLYEKDGSYDEGVAYAGYTSLNVAQATTVLRRLLGVDLYDVINWPGYVTFVRETFMPTEVDPKGIVNFSDAWAGPTSAVAFWTAGRARDGHAQWTGAHVGREHDAWSLVWYDPSVEPAAPPSRPHLWQSELDWIVARTGYTPEDLVVAMRSGGPANHEHADRGSIVVKAFGQVLVADPSRPPYSFSDPSWMMRTTAGHSALLIDGEGHQYHDGSEGTNSSKAQADLVRIAEHDDYLAWTSDATPAYTLVLPDVASATRTVVVVPSLPAVLIFDRVTKTATPSKLQARFFAYNNDGEGRIAADGDTFHTVRPGASLRGVAFAPGGAVARAALLPIPEEMARQHPFAEVETAAAGLSPSLLTVLLPEAGDGGTATAEVTEAEGGVYDVTLKNESHTAHVRFLDTGTIPEYEVRVR